MTPFKAKQAKQVIQAGGADVEKHAVHVGMQAVGIVGLPMHACKHVPNLHVHAPGFVAH